MSKTPRGSSTSSIPTRNVWRDHLIERAAWIKDRDANPIVVSTLFGTWSSGKDGLGWHTEWSEPFPVSMRSKAKYRPGR